MELSPVATLESDVRSGPYFDVAYLPNDGEDSIGLDAEIWVKPGSLGLPLNAIPIFTVTDSSGEVVKGTTISDGFKVTFRPGYELRPNTTYQVSALFSIPYAENDTRQVQIDNIKNNPVRENIEFALNWSFRTMDDFQYVMRRTSQTVTDFARDGNKIVQMGNYLYSYGGWSAIPYGTYNDVYRSDGDLTQWTKMPDAQWAARHTFGIGKIDSTLYIFGGDYFSTKFDVWKSTDGENFVEVKQDLNSLLGPRISYGACVHRSKLYVVGGQSGVEENQGKTDIWTSSNGSFWRQIATDLPFIGKNISGSLESFNGRLWLFGGGYYHNDPQKRTFENAVYSSEDGVEWRREPDAPWTGRQFADVVVWNRRLWVIGGSNPGNLSDIWYMTEDGRWHEFIPPSNFNPRHASGVGVYNDQLVIVCGNYHNDCWVIAKE
jgi:hypothetical protein